MCSKPFFYTLFLICISFQPSCEEYEHDFNNNEYVNSFLHKSVENVGQYAPMANIEGEPSAYVHGCVNVITGQYCEFHTDLVVYHGIDPLKLERSFAGNTFEDGTLGGGWQMNHQSRLQVMGFKEGKSKTKYCFFEDDHGGELHRFPLNESDTIHLLPNYTLAKGITNTARGVISAQNNLRNLKYVNNCNKTKEKTHKIIDGANNIREYYSYSKKSGDIHQIKLHTNPSGNKWAYNYQKGHTKHVIDKIELQNAKNQSLGNITLTIAFADKKKSQVRFTTNDGRFVAYNYELYKKNHLLLSSIETSDQPKVKYSYLLTDRPSQTTKNIRFKTLPDNRTLFIDYYERYDNIVMGENIYLRSLQDPRISRVKSLQAPIGVDSTLRPMYQFIYDLYVEGNSEVQHGSCNVYNALGHRTQYAFNRDQRLNIVNKFQADGQIYTQERLFWGERDTKNSSSLITRELVNISGNSIFARNYFYDNDGNVLVDSLYGNLTGHNYASPIVLPNGHVIENGCDCLHKHQEYTKDGFNLLEKECDGLLTTQYRYEQGSNRLSAKFQGPSSKWQQSSQDKWQRRYFYFYNDDAALVKEISDDGSQEDYNDLSDVTERKIIYYTQSETYPVAYPLIIAEKCLNLETGQEELIHIVLNTYTNRAKISKQDHYDKFGNLAYTLSWDYDNLGNITKEVNAIGQITLREYDANGNCIMEQPGNGHYVKYFTYDYMNRLIKETEIHPDQAHRVITHRYDVASNRIASIDANGNEIHFKYDAFGRLIETIYPPVLNEHKVFTFPVVKKEYDVMSKVTKELNANGVETQMRYTVRGQLAEVIYPDGTTEKNTYCINGLLRESKAKNNSITKYAYDIFGRPTHTEVYDVNGELLSTSSIVYKGSRVLQEIDPMGVITSYTYYPDGKIKTKQKGNQLISFVYDSLARESKTIEHYGLNDTDVIVKIKEYDLIDRVTTEIVEDGFGNVISKVDHIYDQQGNICQTTNYNKSGSNVTKTHYDCHNQLYSITDAEGNQTNYRINYNYRNEYGQIVSYKETTDPKGNISITICDALNRTVHSFKKNAFGKIIQKQEFAYDLKGNLCATIDTVISDGEADQEIMSRMEYDSSNRMTTCYEAYGTPEQKVTKIAYNEFGQKEYLIKNDGVSLQHTYDALGRLKSLQSSDSSIHYVYEYDLLGNPVKVENKIHQTVTRREFNQYGLMIHEELANKLCLDYQYDLVGRTTLLTLPDDTKIAHEYNATLLNSVSRLDASNQISYTHKYESYDLSGNLEKSILASEIGRLSYNYDILGRIKSSSIDTNDWQEQIKGYDSVGNILEIAQNNSFGEFSSSYTYDDLYQVTSETGASPHSYDYDSHYNRRTKNGKKHTLNLLHQLIDDGINTYTYDYNGNMQTKKTLEHSCLFTYDALDRLTSFTKNNQKVVYYYDENNRRLSKTFYTAAGNNQWNEQETIRYLYQGQNEIGAVDKNDRIIELRLLGLGKGAEIGAAIAMEIKNKLYVPIHDHIGNVSCLLDGTTGKIAETYRYSSFGEELFDGLLAICPWRFSSKRTDNESGLIYFGRRYYDAMIGRWVTPDPIGREGGPNLYAYVLNAPLTHFDLYGLFGMDCLGSCFESLISTVGECVTGLVSFASNALGHGVSLLSRQLLPLPYVQEMVDYAGWCLRGENPSAYDWTQFESKFLVYQGTSEGDSRHVHVLNNGIVTSEMDLTQRMAEYSGAYGGVTVYGLLTGGRGVLYDIIETGCQKLGIPTYGQQKANNSMAWLHNNRGEYKDETIYFMEAHSRGTETAYHLDKQYRDRMSFIGFAPARIASEGHYKSAKYYLCPYDGVPLLSPIELYKGVKNGNVHFLPSNANPLTNHFYDNNSFQTVREHLAEKYKEQYGVI